jgi:penicillin-binding protein 2
MKTYRLILFCTLVASILLSSCTSNPQPATPTASLVETPATLLPVPQVRTTHIPPAIATGKAYLEAWQAEDYYTMYSLLTHESQQAITVEDFRQKYLNIANETALKEMSYEILSEDHLDGSHARLDYRVNLVSNLIGTLARETQMNFIQEDGQWRIQFDPVMILPELAGGNNIRMDLNPPTRAPIYDRNGNMLAGQEDAVSIGIYPDYIDPENSDGLFGLLSRASGLTSTEIRRRVENADPGEYIPLGQVVQKDASGILYTLSQYGSVILTNYTSRYYPLNGAGPHLVGYVRALDPEELNEYRRLGYRTDEKVGRKGIERWGENALVGQHGGTLYQLDAGGVPVAELGSTPAEPGEAIYTTIDRDFQVGIQEALRGFRGAAAVIERDTGRVLALASSPGFDPNAFQVENYNWWATLPGVVNDPDLPEFNRASQGLYPLGSVFKVITTAAALESGLYPPDYPYDCQYEFTELVGLPLYDWTWQKFQKDGKTLPTGPLKSLAEGLMRSCNPLFWHLGKGLYDAGKTTAVSDMARAFGLGTLTGIEVVEERPGNVPDPQSVVDAVNLAIGQGDLQVTPLQVANFMAALGNGGNLFKPQAIEKIVSQDGTVTSEFKPEILGSLPLKPENLKIIQDAMLGVTTSNRPRGTAYQVFNGFNIPVYGKTGTATSQTQDPHAWFAAYTNLGRENRPDIAIAVIAENAGEGSEIAAPIVRRIIELYFQGRPGRLYPWEAAVGVTKTPTPLFSETPTPEEGVEP